MATRQRMSCCLNAALLTLLLLVVAVSPVTQAQSIPPQPEPAQLFKAFAGDQEITVTWDSPRLAENFLRWELSIQPRGRGKIARADVVFITERRASYSYTYREFTELNSSGGYKETKTRLKNGQTYVIDIVARYRLNESTTAGSDYKSVSATPVPKPAKPVNFRATSGNKQITLAWQQLTDQSTVTGMVESISRWEYRQKIGAAPYGMWTAIPSSEGETASHVVTGLNNGTVYRFKVRAVNPTGNGVESAEVTATPIPSGKVSRLSVDSNRITEGNAGIKHVNIYITLGEAAPTGGFGLGLQFVQRRNQGAVSFMDGYGCGGGVARNAPDPKADMCWIRRNVTIPAGERTGRFVIGIIGDTDVEVDESFAGLYATGRVDGWGQINPQIPSLTIVNDDGIPTGLVATPGNQQVTLSWTGPRDNNITRWEYQQKEGADGFGAWQTINPRSNTYVVENLKNDVAYAFKVRAVYRTINGPGPPSEEVSATPTAPRIIIPIREMTLDEGGHGSYNVQVSLRPTENVTVVVSDATGGVSVSPSSLTFTPVNWNIPQNIRVDVGEDDDAVSEDVTLKHRAAGSGFAAAVSQAVVVRVRDNDSTGLTVSVPALTITEGSRAAYTVKLNSEPTDDVTVTVGGVSGDISVSSNSLTFTALNWNIPQPVMVSAGDDADAKNDAPVTLTHSAAGGDYDSVTVELMVTVTDDDPPIQPKNFTVSAGNQQANLTWDDPENPNITGWEYQQRTGDGNYGVWVPIANSDATTTTHPVTGLTNGTVYAFKLRAVNSAGNGVESTEVTAVPFGAGKKITLSTAKTRITEGDDGFKLIDISITIGETVTASDGLQITFEINKTASTATTIDPGNYLQSCTEPNPADADQCWIVAPNRGSVSTGSSSSNYLIGILGDTRAENDETIVLKAVPDDVAYTGGSITLTIVDDDASPTAPTDFSVMPGNAQVELSWTGPDDARITSWEYRQKTGSGTFGNWISMPDSDATTRTHTVSNLSNSTVYAFKVRAVNSFGAGTESLEKSATPRAPPASPTGLTATAGDGQVSLSWTDPNDVSITRWEYQQKAGGSFGSWMAIAGSGASTTTYTVIELTNGTEYAFKVRAVNHSGEGGESAEATATPVPPVPLAPTGLTATAGNTQVALSWNNLRDASTIRWEYQQKADGSYGSWMPIPGSDATTMGHTVTGLVNGTTYTFKVRAVNLGGSGAESGEASATPLLPPLKPTGFNATKGEGLVKLSWNNLNNASITRWEYQQRAGGGNYGNWTTMLGSGAATTQHEVARLTNGTTYTFKIRAVNTAGPGAVSDVVSVTPLARPAKPTGFSATSDFKSVKLSWTNPNNNSITRWEYQQRAGTGGSYSLWMAIPNSSASTTTYTVPDLNNGTAYSLRVRAVNEIGAGRPSDVTVATPALQPPHQPTGLSAEASDGQVVLRWHNPNNSRITGYQYQQKESSGNYGGWQTITGSSATTTTHTVTGLTNQTTYTFQIRAVNSAGNSPASAEVQSTPIPRTAKPTGFKAVPGNRQVILTWDDPKDTDIKGWFIRYKPRFLNKWYRHVIIPGSDRNTTSFTVTRLVVTLDRGNTRSDPLNNGTKYDFQVSAYRSTRDFPDDLLWSNVASATPLPPPARPTEFTAVPVGDGAVQLNWNNPNNASITKWQYQQQEGSNTPSWLDVKNSGAATTKQVVTGLTNGTEYTFKIRAVNIAGNGAESGAATVTPTQPGADVSPLSITVEENDKEDYEIKLKTLPPGNVTIVVSGASGDVSVSPNRLTFTPLNWSAAQKVTVSVAKDDDAIDDEDVTLLHRASGGGYNSVSIDSVTVSVNDTTPTLQLLTAPSSVTEGMDISLTVTSDRALTGTHPISLSLADRDASGFTAADISGSLGRRNFDAIFGETASTTGTVAIPTVLDSDKTEGTETYRITLHDATDYEVGSNVEVDGELVDATNLVSVPQTQSLNEGGSNTAVTISTDASFGTSVTFNVSYNDISATGAIDPTNGDYDSDAVSSVTFDTSETSKDIEITLNDDGLDEADETFTVTVALADGSTLPAGFALDNTVTMVTIVDDDETPVLEEIADVTVDVGQDVDITAVATDGDNDAVSYSWARKAGETSPAIPRNTNLTAARLTFTTTSRGTYTMTVTAADGHGNSDTEEVVITVYLPVPVAPTGFRAQAGDAEVVLSWNNPNNPSIDGWEYQQKEGSGNFGDWLPISGADASTTTHTVTGLTNDAVYTFKLRAMNVTGDGDESTEATATPRLAPPDKPTKFTAVAGDMKVTLSWKDPKNASIIRWEYHQYDDANEIASGWRSIPNSGPSTKTYTVTGLANTFTYVFKVRAVNVAGNGVESEEMVAIPELPRPKKPQSISALPSNRQIVLTWDNANNPSIDVWEYQQREDDGDFGEWLPFSETSTTTMHTVTNLTNGVTYAFKVRAVNASGPGDESDEVTAVPILKPPKPTGFSADPGDGQVTLIWTNPNDQLIEGWQVQFKPSIQVGWPTPTEVPDGTATDYVVRNLQNLEYDFRIRAYYSGSNFGRWSDTRSTTPVQKGVTVSTSKLTVDEGGQGKYTVKLNTIPTSEVTIDVLVGAGSDDVSVKPNRLTFTSRNWNKPKTVKVSAAKDEDAVTEAAVELMHSAKGGGYDSVGIDSVTVTVTETTPILQLLTDPVAVTEGADISLTVTSNRALTGTLAVNLTLADRGASGFSAADIQGELGPRNFDATFGDSSSMTGTVVIPTSADSVGENAETYQITLNDTAEYELGNDTTADGTLNDDGKGVVPATLVSVPATLTVTEGTDANATVTITSGVAFGQAVTFNVTYGGTATGAAVPGAGDDYDSDAATQVQFNATDTTKDIIIPLNDDALNEAAETIAVTVAVVGGRLPDGFALGNAVTTVTITDDDDVPTVSIANAAAVTEGDSGDATMTFNVSLSAASGRAVTVDYAVDAASTAMTGTDFTAVSGTLTFSAGQTQKPIAVTVKGDTLDESDETVVVKLSNQANAALGTATGSGTITDDDTLSTSWVLSVSPATVTEVSGTTAVTVTATRAGTATSTEATTIAIVVTGGTATVGTDFSEVTDFDLMVPAGATSGTANFDLVVTADSLSEVNETVTVGGTLQGNTFNGTTVTITDDDAVPTLSIAAPIAAVTEGDSGSTSMTFTVTLGAVSGRSVTVDYAVDVASTAAGTDFTGGAGTLTFAAGETQQSITVSVTGDELDEVDETVVLKLSNPTHATIGTATATGTITDDDASPVLAALSAVSKKVGQTVTVVASATDADGDTIGYAWTKDSGPALPSGTKFDVATLTFTAATVGAYVLTVTASDGNDNEDTKTVTVTVSAADTVSVPKQVTVAEGGGSVTVKVAASAALGQAVTFDVTYGGAASQTADYDATAVTSVDFGTTDTFKNIVIPITDDRLDETDETFTVTIALAGGSTLPAGVILGNAVTTVTITDNDTVSTNWALSVEPATVTEASGTTAVTVTATRAGTVTAATSTTLAIAVTGGTATAGTDFDAVTGFNIMVAAGATSGEADFDLMVTADTLDEVDETLTVGGTLSGATVSGTTVTITDDDAPPALSIVAPSAAVTEGDRGSTDMTFSVTLGAASGRSVTVDYAVDATSTAAAGTDFTGGAGTLTFAPGTTQQSITVSVTGDELDEDDETVVLKLSDATHASIGSATATGTITDDDASPVLAALENETVATGGTVSVTAAATDADGDTVTYVWTRKTGETTPALPSTTMDAATLTFTAGTAGVYTMTVTASDGNGNSATATVVITVTAKVVVSVPKNLTVTEGDDTRARVTIATATAFGESVTFDVTYTDGTATGHGTLASGDYDNDAVTSVTFSGTDTEQHIDVPLNDDDLDEVSERFTVGIALASSSTLPATHTLGNAVTRVTINDDDDPPAVSIADAAAVTEGDSGEAMMTFNVSLSAASGRAVTVDYAVDAASTAMAGTDFTAVSGTLTFSAGQTQQSVAVTVKGDTLDEADETVVVKLSNQANAALGTATGSGTITDDDTLSTSWALSVTPATVTEASGTTAVTVTATRAGTATSTTAITIAIAVTGGTATAGNDFSEVTGFNLTVAAGATSGTVDFNLTVTADSRDEADETVAVNGTLSSNTVTGTTVTITDDDATPVLAEIPNETVKLGQAVTITAVATEDDGDTVTYVWSRKPGETMPVIPNGTALNQARLTFTPPAAGTYTMTVTASDGNGNTDTEEVTITVTASTASVAAAVPVPAQPTGLTTKVNPNNGIILSWTATGDTTITGWEYRIKELLAASPAWGNSVRILGADSGTRTVEVYTRANFWHGQKLEFQVRSVNISGNSPWSRIASATVSNSWNLSFEVKPAEIRVVQGETATYTLTNVGYGVPGRAELSSRDSSVATVPSTVNFESTRETSKQVTVTGVAVGSTVISHDAFYHKWGSRPINSFASFENMATVKVRVVPQKPAKPTGLTARAGNAQVTLSWTDPGNSDITGWEYQRKINSSIYSYRPWVPIPDSSASTTSYTVKNLTGNVSYAFRIRAVNDAGGSPPSDAAVAQVQYQAPAKPIGLKATADDKQITLSWTNPINPSISRWEYQQKAGAGRYGGWIKMQDSNAATWRYTVRNLNNGTNYTFKIRAVNVTSQASAPSDEVTIAPVVPSIVSVPATLMVAEGAGNATVTITTAAAFSQSVTFDVTYGGSSATGANNPANGDYDNDAVTAVTFGVSDTTKDIVIPITDDSRDEKNETFTVTIAPAADLPHGFKLGTTKTTVTITDDDESPVLAEINDVTIKLGETVNITASATDGDSDTITYVWTRLNGETIPVLPSGTDLTKARLTFTPLVGGVSPFVGSSASYTMTVTATDSDGNKDTEQVAITVDEEVAVSVPVSVSVTEGTDANARITITPSSTFNSATTFNVSYSDGTATGANVPSDGDYDNDAVTQVTLSAGDTEKHIDIPITDDDLDEDDETFTVTVAAAAALPGGFELSKTTVTITDDDESPELAALDDVTVQLGQAVDVTAAATDGDGDTVTYAWTRKTGETVPAIPNGTALNAARLTFTPPAAGTYTMTVTASDGNDNTDTAEVTITVSAAAVVSVPATLTVAEAVGDATVTVTTTAAFGESVTLNVTYGGSSATGASNPASGDYDNDAVTAVTFGAADTTKDIDIPITDDDLDEAAETFTVTIAAASSGLPAGWALGTKKTTVTITDDDESPELAALDDVTVQLGQAVDVTAAATDGDGDTVTYAWTRKTGETVPAIPNGTALNAARLTFTPPAAGTYTMTVTASDGNDNTDTAEVTITVSAAAVVSVPATLTVAEAVGDATVTVTTTAAFGESVTLNVTYGGSSATGASNPASGDYDNDAVTAVTFGAADTTKDIDIPITDDDLDEAAETFTVTIAAAESGLPAGWTLGTKKTTVTITDDDESPELAALDDVTVQLGQAVDVTAAATDGDGDTVTYAWTRKTGETVPAIPNGTALNAARLTFTPPAAGTYTMTVTASDGNDNTDTAEVTITVSAAAVVSVPATLTVAEAVGDATVTVTTTAAFGESVTLNVTYGGSSATGASNPASGDYDNDAVTAVTFGAADTTKDIDIPITDDDLDEAAETFTVTIAAASSGLPAGWALGTKKTTVTITDDDESPELAALDDVTVQLGQAVDVTAVATDGDGDTVTYAWTRKTGETVPAIPNGTTLNAARLTFTPPAVGTYTMTVTASDGNDNTDTAEVTITVSAAAVVSVPATLTVAEAVGDATVTVTTTAAFGESVTLNVTYGGSSATGASNPASGDYDNDAVTAVTFGAADTTKDIDIPITDDDLDEAAETFTVTIAAAESGLPAGWALGTKKTTVTITDDDESPELAALDDVTVQLGQAVDVTAAATDGDGDTVTYAWTRKTGETVPAIPNGTALNAARLTFTPPAVGTYTMTVTASDGNDNTDTAEVTITVSAAAVVSVPATLTVAEAVGDATVTVTTTAAFGESVTLNVTYGGSSATGASNPASGDYDNDAVTAVTFGAADTTKDIDIPITDDDLDEAAETFTVTIAAAESGLPAGWALGTKKTTVTITDDDESPELAALDDVTVQLGQAVDVTAAATDGDGDTVTYAWTRKTGETVPAIPNGTALNAARLTFTPPAVGTYTMTVTASDGNDNTDTAEVTITVSAAAVVSVPATLTVAEAVGDATVTVTTTAAFGESVTLNVTYGGSSATGASNPASGDYDNDAVTAVTFGAADTTKDIDIPITDDDLDEAAETFTVTIAAASSGLPAGWALGTKKTTVTITDDDESPELAALDDVTVQLGQAVDVTAVATDGDGDTVTYAWTRKVGETVPAIPNGTTLNAARLTFTPPAVGTYTMTVTASDGNDNTDTAEVTITVSAAAVVSVPATLTVAEAVGDATVTVTTTAAFGESVTLNVTYGGSSATGASNPASGDYDNDAVTAVTFGAADTTKDIDIPITDDDLDEAAETFTVTIAAASSGLPAGWTLGTKKTTVTITDDDESPELAALDDVTVQLGQAVDVTAAATDGDGDTVTYAWTRKAGETVPAIPNGTALNAARLTFTPPAAGTYTMTVTASDGNDNTDTAEVTITVSAAAVVSVPATLTVAEAVGDATVTVTTTAAFGESVTLNVTYGGSSATGASNPASGDYDNDAVTAVTFGAADTTKDIDIPITDDDLDEAAETFTVTIAAASSGLPAGWTLGTKKTTVTITDDDESPELAALDDVTVQLGQAVDVTAAATDGDGDTVTYAWTRKVGETVPAIPNGTALNAARLTFTPPAAGTYTMTVTASDGNDNTDTAEVTITVSAAAVVSVPATLTVAESVGDATVTVTTTAAFGESVTLNVTYGGSSATGASNPASGDYDNDAVTAVTFGAADTTKDIDIPITDDDLDEAAETFTVTIAAASSGLPAGWTLGTKKTTVTITDDDESPELAALDDVTVQLGQAVDVTAAATDGDGDTVTYAWTRKAGETVPAIPNGTTLNAARLTFTPPAAGTYTMTVTASDGNDNTDTAEVTITVSAAAVVSVPATLTVAEAVGDATVTVTTTAAFGESVTLNVTYGGSSATGASNPASGDYDNDAVTAVTFGAADTTKDIDIPITDDDLDEAAETFTVTIAAASSGLPAGWTLGTKKTTVTITDDDESPELAVLDDVTVQLGQAVDVTAVATDGDGDTVTYAWTRKAGETVPAIPNGTTLNAARLTFTPPAVGTYTMTVTASDGNDNTDTAEVTITVSAAAVVSVPATLTVAESVGDATVTVTTTAAFGESVTLNVTYGGSSATGASNPASGDYDNDAVTAVTFGAADTTKDIDIPITDDDLDEAAETFTVTIAAAESGLPAGWTLGTKKTTVTITDDDAVGVTLSVTELTVVEGSENSYTVVLNSEPTADVTIAISGAAGDVTLDKSSLTFTTSNWSTAQTVTVSAMKDEDLIEDADVTLTHSASGGDYDSVTIDSVTVKVTENDASNDEQMERVNRVHSELLPRLVEEMVSVDVVIRRIEDLEGGAPTGNSFRFGTSLATIQPMGLHDYQWSTESSQSRPTLQELMNGAAFNMSVDDTGTSEGGLVFWGQSDWLSLSDSGNNVSWDGEMWSANFGIDTRIRSDLLAGVAVSRHEGQFDAETDDRKSVYETGLNSVQPYMAWLLEDGSNLWTSAGYGDGRVRVKEEGSDSWQTVDLKISNVAVGGRGMLDLDPHMIEGGTTRLAIKGEGSFVRGKTTASGVLQALRVNTHRLRLLLQGSHERTLSNGEQMTSTLEMGVRYDGGETAEQNNLEVGASVSYRNPASRLTLEAHARGLVAAEKERKEWGVGGRVQLDSDAKGRGLYLKMMPTYGNVEDGFNQLFNHKSASAVSSESGFNPRFHLEAELGYGVAVPVPGPLAVLSPYAGFSLAEEGNRTFRLGTRYSHTENLSISIEAERSLNIESIAEHGIALRGEIRW